MNEMKERTKHTPLPWTIDGDVDSSEVATLYGKEGEEGVSNIFGAGPVGSHLEDADFIVRAVNAHDDLVAALKRIEKALRQEGGPEKRDTFSMCEVIEMECIRALAKAEGR